MVSAECPQDFLDWLLQGACFMGKRSHEFESRTLEADAMHEVIFHDQRMLFHLEFQSGPETRIWNYAY
jgi:hypothetical protein